MRSSLEVPHISPSLHKPKKQFADSLAFYTPTNWNEFPDIRSASWVTSFRRISNHISSSRPFQHSLLLSQCLCGNDHCYTHGLLNFAMLFIIVD